MQISGTPVVSGTAYAPAAWIAVNPLPEGPFAIIPEDAREAEFERFTAAAAAVAQRLNERARKAEGQGFDILRMTATLAIDPAIASEVRKHTVAGIDAVPATIDAFRMFIRRIEHGSPLMSQRAVDLKDVRDRILAELTGTDEPGVVAPDTPVVLLGDDLSPATTATLDTDLVLGIATVNGGPTSHAAVIASQLGIPCVVAARSLRSIEEGELVLLNGSDGTIEVEPDQARAQTRMLTEREWRARVRAWTSPARTADGHRVELFANVRSAKGAEKAAMSGADGVGLFRTEMGFLGRFDHPSVDVQEHTYRRAIEAFSGRRVIFRTLDASSDKAIRFMSLDGEDNPALGVRGLRITGRRPDVLYRQLDALGRAARGHEGNVWVAAPMVSTIAESRWFAELARKRGLVPGLMVEVPAAAVMIDRFVETVDFVTLGTNDLTQYVMAADKLSYHLAEYTDQWQPAALRLARRVARACNAAGKHVSVCGQGASDPMLACVYVGMGLDSLSMARSSMPGVGAAVAEVTLEQCCRAAEAVMAADDAKQARALAREALGLAVASE